jgi:hypothetical protein
MTLQSDNYFSRENEMHYMSFSQFKNFLDCQSAAMAMIRGEYKLPATTAMLVGSYVDAYFTGGIDELIAAHPEIFKKDGTLKAEFEQANKVISRIKSDSLMMHYLTGEHQVIKTGEICGVPFKCKFDAYVPGEFICDLKVMRNFERIWVDGESLLFVDAYRYDFQAAIYREIEGNNLPYYIVAATKEDEPDIAVLEVPTDVLDQRLIDIQELIGEFQMVKTGLTEPRRCERCDWCRKTKVLTEPVDYRIMRFR